MLRRGFFRLTAAGLANSAAKGLIQWEGVLVVPYIPVQGSPGVFWES